MRRLASQTFKQSFKRFKIGNKVCDLIRIEPELRHSGWSVRMPSARTLGVIQQDIARATCERAAKCSTGSGSPCQPNGTWRNSSASMRPRSFRSAAAASRHRGRTPAASQPVLAAFIVQPKVNFASMWFALNESHDDPFGNSADTEMILLDFDLRCVVQRPERKDRDSLPNKL